MAVSGNEWGKTWVLIILAVMKIYAIVGDDETLHLDTDLRAGRRKRLNFYSPSNVAWSPLEGGFLVRRAPFIELL